MSGWSLLQNARNDAALSWELLFVSARHYLKKQSPTDPYASPVYADFHDFPPIMVHAGSQEILRDDASRIGDRAAEAGVPVSVEIYDGMQHVFQASAYVPEARISLGRLGNFIKARAQSLGRRHARGRRARLTYCESSGMFQAGARNAWAARPSAIMAGSLAPAMMAPPSWASRRSASLRLA